MRRYRSGVNPSPLVRTLLGPAVVLAVVLPATGCGSGSPSADTGAAPTTSLTPLVPEASVSTLAPPAPDAPDVPMGTSDPTAGPVGFASVVVRVTDPSGEVCEPCMWLATTREERASGLMGVTSLGGLDGMAFAYSDAAVRRFWMKDTLLPLSIAFVDATGTVVDTADMDPCTADPCPNFGPEIPFTLALEVPQGRLDDLGLVPGSTVELAGACPAAS